MPLAQVIPFRPRVDDVEDVSATQPPLALLCEECGGGWFELRDEDGLPGAIAFSPGGVIMAVHGMPVCFHCGRQYALPEPEVTG